MQVFVSCAVNEAAEADKESQEHGAKAGKSKKEKKEKKDKKEKKNKETNSDTKKCRNVIQNLKADKKQEKEAARSKQELLAKFQPKADVVSTEAAGSSSTAAAVSPLCRSSRTNHSIEEQKLQQIESLKAVVEERALSVMFDFQPDVDFEADVFLAFRRLEDLGPLSEDLLRRTGIGKVINQVAHDHHSWSRSICQDAKALVAKWKKALKDLREAPEALAAASK